MELYLKYAAVVLTGLILSLIVGRQSKDLSVLLTLAVCVLVAVSSLTILDPVLDLLRRLRKLADLESDAISILLKTAGVGLISELSSLICSDAGEGAMAKALQLLSNAAILWLSLPLFQQILSMIEGVLAQS